MSQNSLLGRLYSSLKFTHYLTQPESGALLTLFEPPGFGNFHKKNSSFQFKRLKRLGLEPSFQCKLQRNTWSSGWALARQHEPKYPRTISLMTSVTKNPQPPTKKFFSNAIYQTGQSVWALEQLSSAIGRGAMALVRQPKTAVFLGWNRSTNISYAGSQSVKQAIDFAQDTIEFQNLIMNLWSNNASLNNNGIMKNIKTSVLHKICSFCTNFVKFFLYENIENHSWILYGKLAISYWMWKFFQRIFSLRSWVTEATKIPHFSSFFHFVPSLAQAIS